MSVELILLLSVSLTALALEEHQLFKMRSWDGDGGEATPSLVDGKASPPQSR